jgi:capsular exopolysaccharide synthesis family protein
LLIAAFTVAGIVAAIATLAVVPPTYSAATRVLVSLNNARTPAELEQGNNFVQARTRSYVVAARSPLVLSSVIEQLRLPEDPEELAGKIEANAELNTVVITITVSDRSPARAATIAESLVRNFIRSVEDIERPEGSTGSLVKLSLIAPATEPNSPSAPNRNVILAAGTLGGLGLGLVAALTLSRLNLRLLSVDELSRLTRLPVLGTLDTARTSPKKRRKRPSLQFSRGDSYREIRNRVLSSRLPFDKKILMFASPMPGEGTSAIALELAASFSRTGRKVLLIDANLRSPGITSRLGPTPSPGLSAVLLGGTDVMQAIDTSRPDVHVLPAGRKVEDPAGLIDSHTLTELVHNLGEIYDMVILDAPALCMDADSAVLARRADGVILVLRLGRSSTRQLRRALVLLESSGSDMLGIIANR